VKTNNVPTPGDFVRIKIPLDFEGHTKIQEFMVDTSILLDLNAVAARAKQFGKKYAKKMGRRFMGVSPLGMSVSRL